MCSASSAFSRARRKWPVTMANRVLRCASQSSWNRPCSGSHVPSARWPSSVPKTPFSRRARHSAWETNESGTVRAASSGVLMVRRSVGSRSASNRLCSCTRCVSKQIGRMGTPFLMASCSSALHDDDAKYFGPTSAMQTPAACSLLRHSRLRSLPGADGLALPCSRLNEWMPCRSRKLAICHIRFSPRPPSVSLQYESTTNGLAAASGRMRSGGSPTATADLALATTGGESASRRSKTRRRPPAQPPPRFSCLGELSCGSASAWSTAREERSCGLRYAAAACRIGVPWRGLPGGGAGAGRARGPSPAGRTRGRTSSAAYDLLSSRGLAAGSTRGRASVGDGRSTTRGSLPSREFSFRRTMCVWYRPVNDRAAGLSFANDGRRSIATRWNDSDRCASAHATK